jgi:hypothetical protein
VAATLTFRREFLPLEQTSGNASLLALYKNAALDAGLTLDGESPGGCADSDFASAVGTRTLGQGLPA